MDTNTANQSTFSETAAQAYPFSEAHRNALLALKKIPAIQSDGLATDWEKIELNFTIRNYPHYINNYFSESINLDLVQMCANAKIPYAFGFYYFGLSINFQKATYINLHDTDMVMNAALKSLVAQFGLVSFTNAILPDEIHDLFHLNNFAHLNFHRDRNDCHENRYSLYTRTPKIKEQIEPRSASTLFIDNSVAYLQAKVEKLLKANETGRRSHYEIFRTGDLTPLFGKVILEHQWNAPSGYGEVVAINNNAVLHSSYKRIGDHGYPIGARYLY